MDYARKELLVARITSGTLRCRVANSRGDLASLLIKQPSRQQLYIAQEIYQEELVRAEEDGLYSEDELLDFLVDSELWNADEQKLLDALPKDIEDKKVKLFQCAFRSKEKAVIRKALAVGKAEWGRLLEKRGAYNSMSCTGVAALAKARYLLGASLYYSDTEKPVFVGEDFVGEPSHLLDAAMHYHVSHRITEAEYRELARTEPWRSVWVARKACGSLLGCASVDMTDEQKNLISWSSLYDNVYEHQNCPDDSVIEDDDSLDGWLIVQRRERNKSVTRGVVDGLSDKVKNSEEIFIVADNAEDAAKIDDLNDVHGKILKRQRHRVIQKKGVVNECEMPDTAQKIQMEYNRLYAKRATGG